MQPKNRNKKKKESFGPPRLGHWPRLVPRLFPAFVGSASRISLDLTPALGTDSSIVLGKDALLASLRSCLLVGSGKEVACSCVAFSLSSAQWIGLHPLNKHLIDVLRADQYGSCYSHRWFQEEVQAGRGEIKGNRVQVVRGRKFPWDKEGGGLRIWMQHVPRRKRWGDGLP